MKLSPESQRYTTMTPLAAQIIKAVSWAYKPGCIRISYYQYIMI